MTTSSFPVEYDTFPTAPVASAPGIPGTALASGHIDAHALLADAVAKLQRAAGKLGETDPVSIEYRLSSVITAADAAADAAAAAAVDAAVADAKGAAAQLGLSDLIADLGTAAYLNAGTGVGNLVRIAVAGQLPALDGSLLTGLAPGGVTDYADLTGKPTLGTAAATAATDYAPAAKGVTNGDTHDHNGGDGAQIAYGSLSGTPTLGTAAAAATVDFEPSGAISTHNSVTTAHGISSFGATLVDDADAETARTTLGLGSVNNTSDAGKPVSTAQFAALNLKVNAAAPVFTGSAADITLTLSSNTSSTISTIKSSTSRNNAFGYQAQNSMTAGTDDNAFGYQAQIAMTTGTNNNAIGGFAQHSMTTGVSSNAFGTYAQRFLLTGGYSNAFGVYAQYSVTNGTFNNAFGHNAQFAMTSGSYNNAFGAYAQRYLADGATAATNFSYCTHIGESAAVSSSGVTNESVFGANAVGIGSNTVSIGSSAVNRTGLRGSVEIIAATSTTSAQSQCGYVGGWIDSTHATRKAFGEWSAYDYTGRRVGMRIEADGTQVKLALFGGTPSAKPTALTATVAAAPAGGTGTAAGGWDTAVNRDLAIATINNLKTRVDQLEAKLQAIGAIS